MKYISTVITVIVFSTSLSAQNWKNEPFTKYTIQKSFNTDFEYEASPVYFADSSFYYHGDTLVKTEKRNAENDFLIYSNCSISDSASRKGFILFSFNKLRHDTLKIEFLSETPGDKIKYFNQRLTLTLHKGTFSASYTDYESETGGFKWNVIGKELKINDDRFVKGTQLRGWLSCRIAREGRENDDREHIQLHGYFDIRVED